MTSYTHLTIQERELIFLYSGMEWSIRKIARLLKRAPSTISREMKRHARKKLNYSPSYAHRQYQTNKRRCGKKRLLENNPLKETIQRLFIERQWSPEQIANRLQLEDSKKRISYNTIYRAIYRGDFNHCVSINSRGALTRLRRRGRKYGAIKYRDGRGFKPDVPSIHDRPTEAAERSECGHWEADTVLGKAGKACVVTLVDRKSRFLLVGKSERKTAKSVTKTIGQLLSPLPQSKRKTITPDRGNEFAYYNQFSKENNLACYFSDPCAPWQRGSNENTNGLLREYLPKRVDMTPVSEETIAFYAQKLNTRPRKCLGWRTPYEVFYDKVLHLV